LINFIVKKLKLIGKVGMPKLLIHPL
jgi:hypothetical protein